MRHRIELPFAEVTEATYRELAENSFTKTAEAGGFALGGPCPRCAGFTSFFVASHVYLRTESDATAIETLKPAACDCGGPHPGHPAGEPCCGAAWHMDISATSDAQGSADA